MIREEITVNSINNEIEKLTKALERHNARLEKKKALCKKLNCEWTLEEYQARHKAIAERHAGEWIIPLGNDDDLCSIKQNGAFLDVRYAEEDIKQTTTRLENAFKRLEKAQQALDTMTGYIEEAERVNKMESGWLEAMAKREQEYQEWLKQFKADCLKDGVIIEDATHSHITGQTKQGKRFAMHINMGNCYRSLHCYTLYINGQTLFTSGIFATGYSYIKTY